MIISPSILACDFSALKEDLNTIKNSDWIHLDVMDGMFVPNISIGPGVIKSIRKHSNQIFDTHLMIEEPIRYIKEFVDAGSDIITIHFEACSNVLKTLKTINEYGIKSGISIKPNTKVSEIREFLDKVDLVLVMSVEPGFGGQKFIESSLDKIKELDNIRHENDYNYLIEVDGGINFETGNLCKQNGVDCLVAGSFIFKSQDRDSLIKELKQL